MWALFVWSPLPCFCSLSYLLAHKFLFICLFHFPYSNFYLFLDTKEKSCSFNHFCPCKTTSVRCSLATVQSLGCWTSRGKLQPFSGAPGIHRVQQWIQNEGWEEHDSQQAQICPSSSHSFLHYSSLLNWETLVSSVTKWQKTGGRVEWSCANTSVSRYKGSMKTTAVPCPVSLEVDWRQNDFIPVFHVVVSLLKLELSGTDGLPMEIYLSRM